MADDGTLIATEISRVDDDDLDGGTGLTTGIRVEIKYRIGSNGDLEVVHVDGEDG